MIIHKPEISAGPEGVTVSARVEFNPHMPCMPEELWFRVPPAQKDLVTDRSDGFLIAMLLLAMQHGNDIRVKGVVSPKLLSGIKEYQRIFNMWFPKKFSLIDIDCEEIESPRHEGRGGSVVSAFSGGVDSFFTLWSHLPRNDGDTNTQITDTLFIHGFDIRLEHVSAYSILRDAYTEMFESLGINLLTGSTNIQNFDTRSNWGLFHGTSLIGFAHVIGCGMEKFYVPASHTYKDLIPWGTDPRTDHLLSAESLEVIHDGAAYTRVEKTEVLSRWPETYDKLKVCSPGDSTLNCCQCEKCLRTMVTLDMFGALRNYSTFPGRINNNLVRKCRYFNPSDFAFPKEILDRSALLKRYDILFNISYAVVRSRILQLLRFVKIKLIVVRRSIYI